ncbi:sensor histidine kinase [Peribacillus alkalitolerans]|uniref:sensor histidine kinase n=1 Tax=Peribacillus alkalitolerans TaxID=1550385 RepID=UPI0013D162AE|nr:HAMP domain-containing sensor histidine kinase [Peribacillus alkalitolerans]
MIETLLLNFLFLLIPVLILLIFFENRETYYNKYLQIFLSSITMVLCMEYPIRLDVGFIYDLRYVPFIIVALFGGYRGVLPLYFILNLVRFLIGGEGVFHSFLFSTVILSVVPLLSKTFIRMNPKTRITCAALVSFFVMLLYLVTLISLIEILNKEFWELAFHAMTTHVLVMVIIMILIEKIIYNVESRKSFVHSERLNVVSELSASVSHEIRNPLTVTHGFLQLLNQSHTINEEEKRYVEFALQELKRAEGIVSDFLEFAKPQCENMVYSNFQEETEYVKNIMIPYANMHGVQIQYRFANSFNTTYDKNQIQQCLTNLYKNGIEAMKEKGGILRIEVSEYKKSIQIKIKDNGIGMTKEEIQQLGRPYYSTKKEGTGLGMLLVYSTIHKVKGSIEVESVKGKGTTFNITIPV